MKTSYDPGTDSRYMEVRPLPSKRAVEVEADVMVDYGEDGGPVGYDIQHASSKTELIGRLNPQKTSKLNSMSQSSPVVLISSFTQTIWRSTIASITS